MLAIGEKLRRLARVSARVALAMFGAAGGLAVAGDTVAAAAVAAAGLVAGIPAALAAAAKPRAGLLWEGRYAEPWRSERSPGESSTKESVDAHASASDDMPRT